MFVSLFLFKEIFWFRTDLGYKYGFPMFQFRVCFFVFFFMCAIISFKVFVIAPIIFMTLQQCIWSCVFGSDLPMTWSIFAEQSITMIVPFGGGGPHFKAVNHSLLLYLTNSSCPELSDTLEKSRKNNILLLLSFHT